MRICLYTESALPMLGGQELTVDALARQFMQQGHEVVVLAPPPRAPLVADDGAFAYRMVRHPRFISTRYFVPWYRQFLTRLHRSFAFDVLHCHSVYPAGYLGTLARARLGTPVIITSHGGDVAESNNLLRKPGLPERYAFALRNADALVAISGFTRDGYQRLLPGIAIHEIANGVDLAEYAAPAARPPGLADDVHPRGYVLFLGRMARRKGADVLIEALATLPAHDRPLIVLAGAGTERAELEQLSARLGVGDRIRFVGQITGTAKTWLLQNATATVIPSREWEAFPLVVLESFASGTPVIATRIPGLCELVSPGRTGWLVEPESPDALGQTLRDAVSHPPRTKQMGDAARVAAQAYDWRTIAARYLTLYEETIARARGGPQHRSI